MSGSGIKRKRSAGKTKGWWKQPWQIDSLLLDTAALLTALETGHSPCRIKEELFLSENHGLCHLLLQPDVMVDMGSINGIRVTSTANACSQNTFLRYASLIYT